MPEATASSADKPRRRWFEFRSSRVRWPERVVALSATVLLIALVGLSWYSFPLRASGGLGPKYYVAGNSEDGWNGLSHAHWLLLVTILAAFALLLLQATRPAPAVPSTFSLLVLVLGGLSAIWLVFRVVFDPPAGRDFGGWLALVSAAVLTWAGYESLRQEGISPEDAPRDIPTVTRAEMTADKPERVDPGHPS